MADPGKAYLPGRYRWQFRIHVDSSFDFLVLKPSKVPHLRRDFYRFLAGYSDSEGCWSVYFSGRQVRTCWSIESKDLGLIRQIKDRLQRAGFHPLFYLRKKNEKKSVKNKSGITSKVGFKWVLRIARKREVEAMAGLLMSISRHEEKIWKMRLILRIHEMTHEEIAASLRAAKGKMKAEVASLERTAEIEYKKARGRPP